MVDTSLLVALIGVGGTLLASVIGAYINLKSTKLREENESYRTMAEYYLDRKIDSLIELHDSINGAEEFLIFGSLSRVDSSASLSKDEYNKYYNNYRDIQENHKEARLFLNKRQNEIIIKFLIVLGGIVNSMYEDNNRYKINWEKVEENPYIKQHNVELDALRLHSRISKQLIYKEVREPVENFYQKKEDEKLSEEMKNYIDKSGATNISEDDLVEKLKERNN